MMTARGIAGHSLVWQRALSWAASPLALVFLGALVAFSRRYLDLHLGIPGHTGFLWLFFLVLGRGLVRRTGSGLLIGASAGLWGMTMGPQKEGLLSVLLLDLLVAGAVDAGTRLLDGGHARDMSRLAHPLGGLAVGGLAHGAKYVFRLAWPAATGAGRRLTLFGVLPALGSHLLFGALGGLAAALVLRRYAHHRQDSSTNR